MKYTKLWSREYGVMYSEAVITSVCSYAKKRNPYYLEHLITIPEQNNQSFYKIDKEWDKFINYEACRYLNNPATLERYSQDFHKSGKKYVNLAQKISGQNLTEISDQTIIKQYNEFYNVWLDYLYWLWIGYYLSEEINMRLKQMIDQKEIDKDLINNYWKILCQPIKKNQTLILNDQIKKIKFSKNSKSINNIYQKYSWLPCLDIHNPPWSLSDFRKYCQNIKVNQIQKNKSISKVIKELKLTKLEIDLVKMVRNLAYIRDARDEYRRQGVYNSRPFFIEIANRMGIAIEDFSYILPKEIFTHVSIKIIKERKNGFVLYNSRGQTVCISDPKAINKYLEKISIDYENWKLNDINGLAVSKGRVTGRVTIVFGVKDLSRVKNSDILVAITTHPDFIIAMQRAAGFVTDEGGITCHAAIVARELGKPCIVGTKIATKVLKDGDLVEVDAERGIVKKI